MAYDKNGNWVDEQNGRSMMQTLTPNADREWSAARGLAGDSFARGDYLEGAGRLGMGLAGWGAGLMHDVNPVTMAIDKMNQTPARPGFMKVATDVGPGVDRRTGKSTWVDEKDTAKREQIRAQNAGAALPASAGPGKLAFEDLPQASYSNEGRGAAAGPLPITFPTEQQPAAEPAQDVSKFNWQDMAKQIAAMSQGRSMGLPAAPQQMGGWNSLTDHAEEINAERTRRWAVDNSDLARLGPKTRAKLMASLAMNESDNTTRRVGDKLQHAAQMAGQGVTSRGQDMSYNAQMAGQGVTARGQDMNAAAHLATAAMASEDRRANNRDTLEAQAPEREARAGYYRSQDKLHQRQLQEIDRRAEQGADPKKMQADMARTLVQEGMKNGLAPEQIIPYWVMMQSASNPDALLQLAQVYKNRKANGGLVGYADGGPVETPEQVMARIQAKYGVSGNLPQPAPQQQQPQAQQPVRQSAYPQQQPSMMDRLRAVATAGLERRMQGYADGGSVFGDNSLAGLEKRLAAMQSVNNGASVNQAYGSGIRGDLYGGWYAGEQPDRNLTGPNDSVTLGGKRTTINDAIAASDARIQPGVHFGYAQGGPIAVGGRQVLGPGTGKSDSIPAVIDGEQPAALSTGEFVMPVEAVQHFGLDRLNKMVAQARKGLDTGRGQA